jgi:hypothetical protein
MLRIERVKGYRLPRYPSGQYCEPPGGTRPRKVTGGVASVVMLMLLAASCDLDPVGVVGPPPMPPEMVTEKEARAAIGAVFTRNGIGLKTDMPFTFTYGEQKPVSLDLDGFNQDLKVGYEYVTREDRGSFTDNVTRQLDSVNKTKSGGPYVKIINEQVDYGDAALKDIEKAVQAFIDDLRARGVI